MLNPKQEKFCLEYATSGNSTAAYKAAFGTVNDGTARTQASRLLKNPNVQLRLKEIADDVASERIADAQEIQERLTLIIRRQITEETVLPNGERVQRQVSIRDVIRAAEVLCRIQGLFVDRKEVSLNTTPVVIAGGDCLVD